MTWTSVNHLGRRILQLSLLYSLLIVAGCEGSQLGENLGQSLEPDPQLAGDAATVEGTDNKPDSSASGSKPADASTDSSAGSSNSASDKPADDTDETNTASADDKPDDKPQEDTKEDAPPAVVAGDYTDIGKAPEEIQPYLIDLLELDLLEVRAPTAPAPAATNGNSTTPTAKPPAPPAADEFRPNQAMTRREYARWLLSVNNAFYEGERTGKIRPGVNSSQPVFKDVPVTDKDFGAIQGLAEAGMIPSPLTGSSTTINFRPDAPLTRADLLLWKVPLDTRQALPQASISAVQQAWNFQDADKIEPRTLQAVLADYQNGDFANIRRAFSYTTLFQPSKAATRAEGAAVLWRFGNSTQGITAAEIRSPNSRDTTEGNPPADD